MFYLFLRIVSSLTITAALCLPAAARNVAPDDGGYYYYALRILLVTIAIVLAAHYAHGAFEAPITTPEDGPAPPRYMTQPHQYRMGMIAYIGLCLAVYALILGYYRDLAPFLELAAPPEFREFIDAEIKQTSTSFPVVVILGVAALVILLKIEREWNPLFVLRRLVWRWVSIPELANQITEAARSNLVVPAEARRELASDPKNHIDISDFEKGRQNVDRSWAELCYVRLWLTRNLEQGSHNIFFNEPSFAWKTLESDYETMRERITRAKQAPKPEDPFDREVLETIALKVDKLRRKYCRLAACFIVFKNAKKKGTVRDAIELGARIATEEVRANPMRYVVMFILAIVASIYLGVWLSATIWDLVHAATAGMAGSSPVPANGAAATRWVYYGLATFGTPIAVCLMLRYLTWSYDAEQPDSYPASYATIVVVALCVSVASLALATRIGHGVHAHDPWTDLLYRDFKWGWSPALICVYVVYHIDRQIDPLLPDIGKIGGEGVSNRVLACFSFAIFVTLLSSLPTASLEVQPDSPWSIEKLRFVVIGTIFALGFVTALVSQFCLVKPRPGARRGADVTSPALHAP